MININSIWIIFAIFVLFWLGLSLWQGWQQQRRRRAMLQELQVGDEVITIGGIIGRIVEERIDRILLASDGAARLWVAKHAVSARLTVNVPQEPGQTGGGDEEEAA